MSNGASQIASTNEGFGATLHDPVYHYHSVFDSEKWQEEYNDPGFVRHVGCHRLSDQHTLIVLHRSPWRSIWD